MSIASGRRVAGNQVTGGPHATPPGTRGGSARRRSRRRLWAGGAIAAILAVVAVALVATTSGGRSPARRVSSGSPTAHLPRAGLPTLGTSHAVEVNNPALNDVGDPYILPVAAGVGGNAKPSYALYWTTDWSANVPTAVSTDLVHWRRVADALPTLPSWALQVRPPASWSAPAGVSTMTWGPTVHPVAGGFVLYYSTEDARTRLECIGAAFSTSPIGPFVDTSPAPLVCQAALGGDIDPSVVVPSAGHLALVWKNDGN
ncbi:MAG: family 43 glycosylhydrolase, partial [Acidimicrobiales bacterium]